MTINRTERRASVDGKPIDLSPLLFRLLGHLTSHPGAIVGRAELKRALWPYAERIDTERRLNTAVRALRAALGDDADAPRFIATERSYGYRWIPPGKSRTQNALVGVVTLVTIAAVSALRISGPVPLSTDPTATLKAQNAMEEWRQQPSPVSASRASRLLDQATATTGSMPSLLVMKAELELGAQWKWAAAERDYQRALESDPHNSDARLGLAWLRVNQGQASEALALVSELIGSGVLSGDRRASLGWLLIRAGRPDLAVLTCGHDATASINDLSCAHAALASLSRYSEAKQVALQLMVRTPARAAAIEQVRRRPGLEGYRAFLSWRAKEFLPANAMWFQKAQVLADAGATREALEALGRSVANHEPMAVKISSSSSFAPLRGNVRFEGLVRTVRA